MPHEISLQSKEQNDFLALYLISSLALPKEPLIVPLLPFRLADYNCNNFRVLYYYTFA